MAQAPRARVRSRAASGGADNHRAPNELWGEILWFADFWDEPEPIERRLVCDLERLQGAWTTVEGKRPAELLISGQHLTVHFRDGEIYMGTFALGTSGKFVTLDVQIEEGPPRHRGQTVLCLCELDGDSLRWCNASPGIAERPGNFDNHNPHLLCLMLRREHRTDVR
jgi:uncharacterized protein (TIGR03067 family)